MADYTAANAPRTYEELFKLSPFNLRSLAEELGGLADPRLKFAWGTMAQPERAQAVLNLLTGAGPAAAAPLAEPHAPPPQRQPVTNASNGVHSMPLAAPQVSGVSAEALAGATEAASEKPSGRKPKTDAGASAESLALLQRIMEGLAGDSDRFKKLADEITTIVREASADKAGRVAKLEDRLGLLESASTKQNHLLLAILWVQINMAEGQFGTSSYNVLKQALGEVDTVQEMMKQLASGK